MRTNDSMRCLLVLAGLLAFGCGEPALLGEECIDSGDCDEGLSCFEHEGAALTPVCMRDCDLETTRLCDGAEVCLPPETAERELGVCYLGGTVAVGEACESALECVSGSICVEIASDQSCFRACDPTGSGGCEATETCTALVATENPREGYCAPTP